MNKVTTIFLVTLASAAFGQRYTAPRGGAFGGSSSGPVVPILRDDRNGPDNGVYDFWFQTGNGIERREQGAPTAPNNAVESQGSWSFTFPDGTPAKFNFVADENGYRPESSLIPTPPPLPPHAIEQIEFARRNPGSGQSSGGSSFNRRGRYN
ncbi:Insect cuticle protein [Trinorchestia longiramus]|nr:Insect cuticle protein [Trinorchestia longiramus]